jgi:hypothetical protein
MLAESGGVTVHSHLLLDDGPSGTSPRVMARAMTRLRHRFVCTSGDGSCHLPPVTDAWTASLQRCSGTPSAFPSLFFFTDLMRQAARAGQCAGQFCGDLCAAMNINARRCLAGA